jgi:uncharacterized Zn finger protein
MSDKAEKIPEEQMITLPELTESDVRRWTDERSFGRGRGYFRGGYILNPRRQGNTIEARCQGSRPQPYHVEITLGRAYAKPGGGGEDKK